MARILLQTTIAEHADDWDVSRFSLLADELRAAGHQVIARNRVSEPGDDPVLSRIDELGYEQLWLMAVDIGHGLTDADAEAIVRFRRTGGGLLTARDHENLGSCLCALGSIGDVNHFHDENAEPGAQRDDQDTPTISWPNFHSGANGDYQPVFAEDLYTSYCAPRIPPAGESNGSRLTPTRARCRRDCPSPRWLAEGRSTASGRHFNLAVALDGEVARDGRPMGRALAASTFHHFADYNWDLDRGAPSFVTEPPGHQIKDDPSRLTVFKDYVRNIAAWLSGADIHQHAARYEASFLPSAR